MWLEKWMFCLIFLLGQNILGTGLTAGLCKGTLFIIRGTVTLQM